MSERGQSRNEVVAPQAGRPMSARSRRWVRAGMIYLTVTFLSIGLWATFDTKSFYDAFPGGGHRWVAGDGPYNAHLVSDVGVGYLAVGAVLLLAAVWMERRLIQAAMVGATLHNLFHLLFHLRNASEALDPVDRWVSNGGLGIALVLSVVVLSIVSRRPVSDRTLDQQRRLAQEAGESGVDP